MAVETAVDWRDAEWPVADQWVYVGMAGLFVLTAVIAFVPTSTALVADVVAGNSPLPPVMLHLHAAAMVSWLLLFVAQTVLVARGKRRLHRTLGTLSFLLAPLMVIGMVGVVSWRFDVIAALPSTTDPALLHQAKLDGWNLTLINAGSILLFPVFYVWAILARRKDSETHKRMMILATVVLMSPAIGRMVAVNPVLPALGLNGADARHLYELLLLTPALVYDTLRRGMPHRAYLVGLGPILAYMTVAHFAWGASWWP